MTFPSVLLVAGGAAFVVLGTLALHRPGDGTSRPDAVPLTTASERMLADAARRTRRFQIVGAVLVSAVAALTDLSGPVNLITIAAGFAAGSLVAELTRWVRPTGVRRLASLSVRGITDHVPPVVPVTIVVSIVLLAGLTVSATALPGPGWNGELPTDRWFVVTAIVSTLGAATSLTLARWIARQPVDLGAPAPTAAHHRIRSAAVRSVLGGGMISVGVGIVRVAGAAALHDSDAHVVVRHTDNVAFWLVGITLVLAGVWSSFEAVPRPRRRATGASSIAAVSS